MRIKTGLFALVVGGLLLSASVASAQRTTGGIRGAITDDGNGEAIAGATVVISGPAMQGTQTYITEADGLYEHLNLPPGIYIITVYYLEGETRRSNALVQLGKIAVINIKIKSDAATGEVIEIAGRAPIIDQGSTKTGNTITPDYTDNIPTGRTFGGVLGTAAGSQGDTYGVSFGGSTSAENTYIVEGINTTDPAFGLQSTNLPNEFINETEVITGGYNAEYGRSTGGVINVLTKSGGNEFHGSVFTYFTPGQLTAEVIPTPSASVSIERIAQLDYVWSLGAELGGPIIKDKVWFHVGLNPTFTNTDLHRSINRQFQAPDGGAVVDANGFNVVEEVSRTTRDIGGRGPGNLDDLYFTLKLSGAISPDHQGSVAFLGNPSQTQNYTTLNGAPDAGLRYLDTGALDVALKWLSKFNNNKTQVNFVGGFHRNQSSVSLPDLPLSETPQLRDEFINSLENYSDIEAMHYEGIPSGCVDDDPTDGFTPCPVNFYNLGGYGFFNSRRTDRLSALLTLTQRVKLAGQHNIKLGLDVENNVYENSVGYTGGRRVRNLGGFWRVDRRYQPDPDDATGRSLVEDQYITTTTTNNFGAFLQDSWAILPNLTFNAGLRFERQGLEIADQLQAQNAACRANATTPGETLLCGDDEAFSIADMWAPRFGVVFDPTQEGRSKIQAHWGRFYESIPMDINARAFGGEITNIRLIFDCPNPTPGDPQCDDDPLLSDGTPNPNVPVDFFFGGGEEGVVPGLGGQYLDEYAVGGEYELLNDFKVGVLYQHRELGRVVEDFSTDGGNTYVIGNPGEVDADLVQEYIDERQVLVDEMLISQADLDAERELLLAAADFDKPVRKYDALVITAQKRFSKAFMLLGSYTYSRLYGNFPGLFSTETGQLDPNLTSMFDLPDLMANRTGRMGLDRPHLLKVDSFYRIDMKKAGQIVVGSSVRAQSGIPHNVLGAHPLYGLNESYILPRGILQRSPLTSSLDVHLSYGRRLSKNMQLQGFVRIFNLFNQQPPVDVQELYTQQNVNPCVGCDFEDLPHVKALNPTDDAADLSSQLVVDPNFGNTSARQAPRSFTLGARLTF